MGLWKALKQPFEVKSIEVVLPFMKIKFEREELEESIGDIIAGIQRIVSELRPDQIDALRKLISCAAAPWGFRTCIPRS